MIKQLNKGVLVILALIMSISMSIIAHATNTDIIIIEEPVVEDDNMELYGGAALSIAKILLMSNTLDMFLEKNEEIDVQAIDSLNIVVSDNKISIHQESISEDPIHDYNFEVKKYEEKKIRYATKECKVRKAPNQDADIIRILEKDEKVKVIGKVKVNEYDTNAEWKAIKVKSKDTNEIITGYVNAKFLCKEVEDDSKITLQCTWTGEKLSKSRGAINGPSGKETYYNLNMSRIVQIMRDKGFSEEEYPYWTREDGAKMLGDYVMVAADFNTRPRGSFIECSLGWAIVCDTGTFARSNPTQLDIATTW